MTPFPVALQQRARLRFYTILRDNPNENQQLGNFTRV